MHRIVLTNIQPFIDALSDIVLVYGVEGIDSVRLVAANDAASKAGITKDHIGRLMNEVVDHERYEWLSSVARHVIKTQTQYRFEREFDNDSGKFNIDVVLTPVVDKGRCSHILLVARDFTQLKNHEKELEFIAFHDSLTGAYNRAFFRERLDYAISHHERNEDDFSVALLDLDGFKGVNDTFGHQAGNAILTELSTRINSAIRSNDTFARMGGDEFAVIFEGLIATECVPILERLMAVLSRPWEVDGQAVNLTCSLGITDTATGNSALTLLRNADRALYQAKRNGKNQYVIYAS
ncbi:GGDEF domain-containing protein [Alicyclobacillus fastidiosus]|uniref:GGDEF domain-containing protein n=1 Tax=Alicyclobacillus fastidiosus TaxID=392011 RepID=A0ABV5ABX4_9BACL|nr:GGDEF domain-containing protein [Alicyclobacillus fastidiosus]WEH10268.1 GGDEF domain-containing protein [Alicyclobacillus fastidiosus]